MLTNILNLKSNYHVLIHIASRFDSVCEFVGFFDKSMHCAGKNCRVVLTRAIEPRGDGVEEGVLGREQPLAHGHPLPPRTPRTAPTP